MAKKKATSAKHVISRLRPMYQPTFIKQWREYRDMSQTVLADKVGAYLELKGIREKGYTHATIGRIENGKMPYKQPIMEGIADVLGVSVDTLIARPPPTEPGKSDPIYEFRGLWDKAAPDQRTMLIDIAKTIVGKTGTEG